MVGDRDERTSENHKTNKTQAEVGLPTWLCCKRELGLPLTSFIGMERVPLDIPDKYKMDGKTGRVQGRWVASKILEVRKLLALGGGWTATAQKALNFLYEDEQLKVL